MFFLDSEIGVSTAVYTVNQSTGQLLFLGSIDIMLGEATGLAADGANLLYVTTLLGNVIRVDLMPSYMATTLGNVGGKLTQLQLDGGLLYTVDEDTDELSSIQIMPLTKTVIGTIRVGSAMGPVLDIIGGDLSRDSLGNWYLFTNSADMMSSSGKLYALNITTAVATEIGPMMWLDGRITGLAFDYGDSDKLYASARDIDKLLTLDPATGMVTDSVDMCESCPTVFDVRAGDLGVPFGTATATATPTDTPTSTATTTDTPTASPTLSPTLTVTATTTATSTNPPLPTQTRTPSSTGTVTATGTETATPTITPLSGNGDPCSSPAQCQSMNCVDGVCCDTPCDGPDELCNLPGREGTCVAITAAPAPTLSWPAIGVSVSGLVFIAAARLLRRRRRG